jgi:hypothetical protein
MATGADAKIRDALASKGIPVSAINAAGSQIQKAVGGALRKLARHHGGRRHHRRY